MQRWLAANVQAELPWHCLACVASAAESYPAWASDTGVGMAAACDLNMQIKLDVQNSQTLRCCCVASAGKEALKGAVKSVTCSMQGMAQLLNVTRWAYCTQANDGHMQHRHLVCKACSMQPSCTRAHAAWTIIHASQSTFNGSSAGITRRVLRRSDAALHQVGRLASRWPCVDLGSSKTWRHRLHGGPRLVSLCRPHAVCRHLALYMASKQCVADCVTEQLHTSTTVAAVSQLLIPK